MKDLTFFGTWKENDRSFVKNFTYLSRMNRKFHFASPTVRKRCEAVKVISTISYSEARDEK